jgi:hypothetical protein
VAIVVALIVGAIAAFIWFKHSEKDEKTITTVTESACNLAGGTCTIDPNTKLCPTGWPQISGSSTCPPSTTLKDTNGKPLAQLCCKNPES